jgi:hypothetical protein
MVAYLWSGGTWSAPLTVQSNLASGPSCSALSSGKAVCAARSTVGGILSAVYSGGTWATSSWTSPAVLTDVPYSPVNCTPDDAGHAICAYLTNASVTLVREFGTSWSGAINLGGAATNPPTCSAAGVGGKAACFATGTESALYGSTFAGGSFISSNWTAYGSLGGLVHSFSCTQNGQKAALSHYVCGAIALSPESNLYTNEYNGSAWAGWTQRGTTTFIGTPACFPLNTTITPGKVMCVLTNSTNKAVSITGP